MVLETIYKKSKTGAVVLCNIYTSDDIIVVETGQVGGAITRHTTLCEPKNVGRANETSGIEQAEAEALAKHTKKIKAGYTTDPSGEITVRLPMKVKVYQDQKKNIIFPCYGSPKLNGVNGEYRLEDGELKLYSRGGNEYPIVEHHIEDTIKALTELNTSAVNGEIYIHGEHLQDITGAVKKFKSHITPRLEFHAFDLPEFPGDYHNRSSYLEHSGFNAVEVVVLTSHEDIEEYHTKCEALGYEGIVIRNGRCKYEYNVRSSDAFKYKKPKDAEYKVVGYKLDKYNHAVFICTTGSHEFSVKMIGTNEERLAVAAKADSCIGLWLNIEYEELSKDLKPLKPVGQHFRDCDEHGNPKE